MARRKSYDPFRRVSGKAFGEKRMYGNPFPYARHSKRSSNSGCCVLILVVMPLLRQ